MMTSQRFLIAILYGGLMFWPASGFSQESTEPVDPEIKQILREMADYLKAVKQFTFQAEVTFDQVLDTGQKLQYTAVIEYAVRRSNGFYSERKGDLVHQRFWYDGKTFTVLDKKRNLYATIKAPPKIDAAMDYAMKQFNIKAPLSDLASSRSYSDFVKNVKSGSYVGSHEVRGVRTHHLAFQQEDIDWQIWIEDGKMLVPRKIVITYKSIEGAPQFTAVFDHWDLSPRLPDALFTFVPTDEYEEIEFLPVESASK